MLMGFFELSLRFSLSLLHSNEFKRSKHGNHLRSRCLESLTCQQQHFQTLHKKQK